MDDIVGDDADSHQIRLGDESTPSDAHDEELKAHLERLETQNEDLEAKLQDATLQLNRSKQRADQLSRENEALKQEPLFIATVEDVTDDGVVIRQHGNNQEALTEVTDEQRENLSSGDRVTINNNLSVVGRLPASSDVRVQAMQVEHSPDVRYDQLGGVDEQLAEVRETVELPLDQPELFDEVGIDAPSGVLLHGPPGTGKTMLAKAVATQTDATFIKMAGSELVHKYIGEGARLVRDLFETARQHGPAVVFIDELDAIASKRTDSKTSGDSEVQRTLMQLLSELDGFDDRGDVRLIAATNRVDMLDDAILRPGRFDRRIEIAEPDEAGRQQILDIHTRDMNLVDDVDLGELAAATDSLTGAELEGMCTEAGMFAIRDGRTAVEQADLHAAAELATESSEDNDSPVSVAFA